MSTSRRSTFKDRLQQRRHRPDYWLVILSLALLAVGLIVVYGIRPLVGAAGGSESYYVSKQILAVGLGVVAFGITANLPLHVWRRVEKPLIISSAIAALAVAVFGQEVNGASRWIQIGGLSFQAVELIKFTLIIWLAGFLSDRLKAGELQDKNRTLKPLLAVLVVLVGGDLLLSWWQLWHPWFLLSACR
jgi:cell division protein FtsW